MNLPCFRPYGKNTIITTFVGNVGDTAEARDRKTLQVHLNGYLAISVVSTLK